MSTQTDIKKLFNKARRILKHPGLDLLVAPATESATRLIIIITPGRIGTAVERNTVRRRIKAIFYEEKLATSLDCVIIVKKPGTALSHEQLKQLLTNAFAQHLA